MFDTVPPRIGDGGQSAIGAGLSRPAPGIALLTVQGEVDTLTAPRLESAIDELLQAAEPVLVTDLTEVRFLASCGLAVLIRAAHHAATGGRRIRLVTAGRPVLRPLRITGTDTLFDMHTDLAAALLPHRD